MKKQTIKVNVQHNINLHPLKSASVFWSEHFVNPDDEHHSKTDQCKEHVTVTNEEGIALLETVIETSEPDGFNIPFKYYTKVWISIDRITCTGFKDCEGECEI